MTITRKQLELAAKAAGIDVRMLDWKEPDRWHPTVDHGQLLDLAMACEIGIRPLHNCIEYSANDLLNVRPVDFQDFPALAEAIITAAAEQQLAKETKE